MTYDDVVKKLLTDMGFEPRIVCHIAAEKQETGSTLLRVFVDNTMFSDVPFLANGKIVALLQALVKKLPDKFEDGTLVEWRFEPILKTDPIEEMSKESSPFLGKGKDYKVQHRQVTKNLALHSRLMEELIEHGEDKSTASKTAYEMVVGRKSYPDWFDKKADIRTASYLDASDIKILDSAVGKLGKEILKSPAAIDILVGLHVAQHIINKFKESVSHKVPAAGSEGFWRNPNDWS